MANIFEESFLKLKSDGFRLTETRKNLVKFILSLKGHWTIQHLEYQIHKKFESIGVATIYRTVHLLARLNILSETKVGSGAARYEVAPYSHHDHLTCLQCDEIFEFKNDEIEELQTMSATKLGFRLVDHRMELYGDCQKKSCPHKSQKRRAKSK